VNERASKVLVVDDNRLYREAIRRNLEFVGYQILEAENLRTALEEIRIQHPQVVITDLDMSHRTEGLDLIREVKARYPLIPVILVSAVGTFEEGAQAQELGATAVISKSRIDEELENLYACLDEVFDQISALTALKVRVDHLLAEYAPEQAVELETEINKLIASIKSDNSIKGELYEWMNHIKDRGFAEERRSNPVRTEETAAVDDDETSADRLEEELGPLDVFEPETQTMLLAAEKLMSQVDPNVDSGWSRNVGFSYSFAVENEVKQRMGKRFSKLVGSNDFRKLLPRLYDRRNGNLSLGLSRYLLLNQAGTEELTPDLVRQVLERMIKHEEKYKADGLKALGVITFLFGRDHEFEDLEGKIRIDNLLGLRGLDNDDTARLGLLLIRLQHTRNPFIHPEFSEREKLTVMRQLAVDCLALVKKILE